LISRPELPVRPVELEPHSYISLFLGSMLKAYFEFIRQEIFHALDLGSVSGFENKDIQHCYPIMILSKTRIKLY
jgi:hypothetical protein